MRRSQFWLLTSFWMLLIIPIRLGSQQPPPQSPVPSPVEQNPQPAAAPEPHADPASLGSIKTIFVVPMKNRLEHFLTNELVRWGRYSVTLNPRQADAVLSDTTEIAMKDLMLPDAKIRKTTARTRGTAFLLDVRTEKVIWSVAKDPSQSFLLGGEKSTRELAKEIVQQLKEDLKIAVQ